VQDSHFKLTNIIFCRDAMCGKLQCNENANTLVYLTNFYQTSFANIGNSVCNSVVFDIFDVGIQDPGLVPNGAKCGDGMVRRPIFLFVQFAISVVILSCRMNFEWNLNKNKSLEIIIRTLNLIFSLFSRGWSFVPFC